MLMSKYDPVTKRVIFGKQLGQAPGTTPLPMPGNPAAPPGGQGIKMPDGSVQNYVPSVIPQDAGPPDPNASAFAPMPAAGPLAAPPALAPSNTPTPGLSMTMPEGTTRTPLTPGAVTPLPAPTVGAPAANSNGGMMRLPLGQYYTQLEQERGLPGGFLAKTRAIESSNGTRLQNPNSSAKGDFQFINSTAKSMGLSDPMDPYASAKAAADLAAKNMAGIKAATGQDPDGAALYMAHQQGLGGYLGLTRGVMPKGAASSLNGGDGQTAGGFLSMYRDKFNNAQVKNLDGFTPQSPGENQGQGPTVAAAKALDANGPTGEAMGPPAPNADQQAQLAAANKYQGGLLGLAGIGDQSAPGMGKDFMGKLGDMASSPGGGALGGFAKAIGALAQGQSSGKSAGGITLQANTQAHDANPGFMQYLDPRAKRRAGFLSGG